MNLTSLLIDICEAFRNINQSVNELSSQHKDVKRYQSKYNLFSKNGETYSTFKCQTADISEKYNPKNGENNDCHG